MGMFDHVVVLDETLRCPHGHRLDGFQTKSFDNPLMDTYLIEDSHVHRVGRGPFDDAEDGAAENWILDGGEVVFERRCAVESVVPPAEVVFYTTCRECTPVLVRGDRPSAWGDLVDERQLWVEFRATFGGEGRLIERTSGTRDDLATELRDEGLRVVRDDEPLALAHQEIRAAHDRRPARRTRARR